MTFHKNAKQFLEIMFFASGPAAALITTPFLARALGPEDRGILGVALAVAGMCSTIGNFGQAETFLSQSRRGLDSYSVARHISRYGGILMTIVSFFALLSLGVPAMPASFASIWVYFAVSSNLWRSVAISRSNTMLPALSGLYGSLLRLIFIPALALTGLLSINVAISISQGAVIIGAFCSVGYFTIMTRRREEIAVMDRKDIAIALRSGFGIISFDLINAVTLRSDIIFLQLLSNPKQVGIYAAVAALSQSASAVSAFFKNRAQVAVFGPNAIKTVRREYLRLAIIGFLAVTAVNFLSQSLVDLLFGNEYKGAAAILRIISFAALGQMILDMTYGLMVVLGHRRQLITVGLFGASTTLILLGLLVPNFGASGAAIAVSSSTLISAIIGTVLVFRTLSKDARAERA